MSNNSSKNSKKRIEIGYSSSSKQLCKGIQSLLLRFGINSILQKKKVKYKDGINVSYVLGIYSTNDCKKFIEKINIFSKENATQKVLLEIQKMNSYGTKYPIDIYNIINSIIINQFLNKNKWVHVH